MPYAYSNNPTVSIYHCKACAETTEAPVDDPYEGYLCPRCHQHVCFEDERPARWVSVAMYETDRIYGGPEEGGWYYTAGHRLAHTVRAYEAGDLPQAQLYHDQLWAQARAMSEGDTKFVVRFYAEELPESHFPKSRPVYC